MLFLVCIGEEFSQNVFYLRSPPMKGWKYEALNKTTSSSYQRVYGNTSRRRRRRRHHHHHPHHHRHHSL